MQANKDSKRKKKSVVLHKLYKEFLADQTHVKPRTMALMTQTIGTFPNPEELNGDHFRKRMKKVSPATIHYEVGLARRFLKWAKMDGDSLQKDNLKLPKIGETVTVEDLYTGEELQKILGTIQDTRDRAMLEVLYETAVRSGELLSMTFENLRFNPDEKTAFVIVKGKTGTREIPIYASVPCLKVWMNVHPTGKGPLWIVHRGKHRALGYAQLYQTVKTAMKKAGLVERKRIIHMFRHTRATELVRKGIRGQTLSRFMGWTKGSNMESVYVHLSTTDVNNEIMSKVFGLEGIEETIPPLLSSTKCPSCENENPQGSRVCANCNMPLSNDAIVKALQQQKQKKEDLEKLVQKRVDESMLKMVEAFATAIESLDTEVLKDLAVAFSREMNRDTTLTDQDES